MTKLIQKITSYCLEKTIIFISERFEEIHRGNQKKSFSQKIWEKLLARHARISLGAAGNLLRQYNLFSTAKKWNAEDKEGNPIPWISFPAYEYLEQLDLSDKTVFEFGSGNSTLYWAKRVKSVISIEDDKEWYEKIKTRIPSNTTLLLRGGLSMLTKLPSTHPLILFSSTATTDIESLAPKSLLLTLKMAA